MSVILSILVIRCNTSYEQDVHRTYLAIGGTKKRIIPITPGYGTLSTLFLLPIMTILYRMINGPGKARLTYDVYHNHTKVLSSEDLP
jgi:hypothetical protein